MRSGEYEKASRWLAGGHDQELSGPDRRDWLHLEMDLFRYRGENRQALGKLEELYAFENYCGIDIEMVRSNYTPIEQDLALRMGGDDSLFQDEAAKAASTPSGQELLLENYPNTFNPTTQIRFTLPEQSQVSLVIYDMLGRQVTRLVDDLLPAGEQTVRFDASNLANGVYTYRLQANQDERVRMMTLIK